MNPSTKGVINALASISDNLDHVLDGEGCKNPEHNCWKCAIEEAIRLLSTPQSREATEPSEAMRKADVVEGELVMDGVRYRALAKLVSSHGHTSGVAQIELAMDDAYALGVRLSRVDTTADGRAALDLLADAQIDRVHYTVTKPQMTGTELRHVPQPPIGQDRDLFEVVPGGQDIKIEDSQVVQIRNGQRFFTAPAQINPGCAGPRE